MAFSPPPPPRRRHRLFIPLQYQLEAIQISQRGGVEWMALQRGFKALTRNCLVGHIHQFSTLSWRCRRYQILEIGAHNTLTGVDSTHHFTLGNTPSNKFRISKRFKLMRFRHNPTPRHRATLTKFLLRQLFGTYLTVIGILEKGI